MKGERGILRALNLAHRGFSGKYPENTLLAFHQAYLAGADGVELDVQLTSDGEVVIFHDESIDRMTNGSGVLSEMTLEDVRAFIVSSPSYKGLPDQKILTLQDYLNWVEDKDFITNIELKSKDGKDIGLEKKVLDLIASFQVEERIILSSFHHSTMSRIKAQNQSVKTGLLVPGCDKTIIDMAKQIGMDYIHPHALSLTEDLIDYAVGQGLEINTWTVNEIADLEKVTVPGIHAIITDYPDRLKALQDSEVKIG